MTKGFEDRKGVEWHPVWHGENVSDWLRYTGISLDQFTTMKIPAFSIVEAMWYTCRQQARELNGRNYERTQFLRRFDPSHIIAAIEVLVDTFNESMPKEEDIPAPLLEATDDAPLPEDKPEADGTPG